LTHLMAEILIGSQLRNERLADLMRTLLEMRIFSYVTMWFENGWER